jgi:hypothetical protein
MQKPKLLEGKGVYYEPGVWDLVAYHSLSTFPVLRFCDDRHFSDKLDTDKLGLSNNHASEVR